MGDDVSEVVLWSRPPRLALSIDKYIDGPVTARIGVGEQVVLA